MLTNVSEIAFRHLSNLEILYLVGNCIRYECFQTNLFKGCFNLRTFTFWIQSYCTKDDFGYETLYSVFRQLSTTVTTIRTDIPKQIRNFSSVFVNLRNLENLEIQTSGNDTRILYNDTFQPLSHLPIRKLKIQFCLSAVEPLALFLALSNLDFGSEFHNVHERCRSVSSLDRFIKNQNQSSEFEILWISATFTNSHFPSDHFKFNIFREHELRVSHRIQSRIHVHPERR